MSNAPSFWKYARLFERVQSTPFPNIFFHSFSSFSPILDLYNLSKFQTSESVGGSERKKDGVRLLNGKGCPPSFLFAGRQQIRNARFPLKTSRLWHETNSITRRAGSGVLSRQNKGCTRVGFLELIIIIEVDWSVAPWRSAWPWLSMIAGRCPAHRYPWLLLQEEVRYLPSFAPVLLLFLTSNGKTGLVVKPTAAWEIWFCVVSLSLWVWRSS